MNTTLPSECSFYGCTNSATKTVTLATTCGCAESAGPRVNICDAHPPRAPRPVLCLSCGEITYRHLIPN